MSTLKANAYLDSSGGTTATINGITPISLNTLNASGSAPVYACRAWVNFNGVTTITIRASGNVSSVVRNSTGNYTINFTTPMQDANYASVISVMPDNADLTTVASGWNIFGGTHSASSIQIGTGWRIFSQSGGIGDCSYVNVAIFR